MNIVHEMDLKYGGKNAPDCPKHGQTVTTTWGKQTGDHGKMAIHKSGAYLICGICGAQLPTSNIR